MKMTMRLVLAVAMAAATSGAAMAAEMAVPCSPKADVSSAQSVRTAEQRETWRYPHAAVRQRAEGTVLLKVQLDTQGAATSVKLATSSGFSVLDRAALKAAKEARFCKLAAPGDAMTGLAEVSVHYSLNVAVARL